MATPSEIELIEMSEKDAMLLERRRKYLVDKLVHDRSLYSDSSGQPILRMSYVVYIDVLGTKETIKKLNDDELRTIIDERDRFLVRLHDPQVGNWGRMVSFTDNIVYGEPARAEERGELVSLARAIGAYQKALTAHGHFLRGGLVRGSLYIDSAFATGAGLLHAIDLEETKAIYPRVLLARNVLSAIDLEANRLGAREISPHNHFFLVDEDGETFVNYLASGNSDPVEEEKISVSMLTLITHMRVVQEALVEHSEPGRVRDKILWAAHLHNWMCDQTGQKRWRVHYGLSQWEQRNPRRFEWLYGRPPRYGAK